MNILIAQNSQQENKKICYQEGNEAILEKVKENDFLKIRGIQVPGIFNMFSKNSIYIKYILNFTGTFLPPYIHEILRLWL